ncbi:MAG: SusC/RagA family TonB-linked outer membrane protein, partial [Gemmatimonadota bacterium]
MHSNIVRRSANLGLALLLAAATAASAQQGRLAGTVTDQATGKPLEASRVVLTGTNQIETTNQDGKYTFRTVAPGTYQIRALRIGYAAQVQSITIAAGETAALNFAMIPAPVQLDEIVSTATGEQRKLEVANNVATIDAAGVAAEQPITQFGDLISGRAAGVDVLKSGGTTGTGTRIRIRGSNSISLSNEPLYYIDGIRMESNPSSLSLDIGGGIGGGATSAINDINPDDIESIEIVKGPAAATLYGIQAANGVVRITTKRGTAGKPKWNVFAETGAVQDKNKYPTNYFGLDSNSVDFTTTCSIQNQIDGLCTQTGIATSNPLMDPATRPLATGFRQSYGASVAGGNELATYFLSTTYDDEVGVFKLPRFEADSIMALRGSIPANQLRPNTSRRLNLRANVASNLSSKADVSATLGYVTSDTRVPENDNSFLTITGSGEASANPADVNRGWFFTPAELFAELSNQNVARFTGGLTGNWRPASWLSTRATLGYDVANRTDIQFFPTGQVANYLENNLGVRTDNKTRASQTSVDLGATATYKFAASIAGKTSVGAQWFRDLSNASFLTGRKLAPGSTTITGAGNIEGSENSLESRSVGTFLEQQLNIKQRLFLTGAFRIDNNSAFGANLHATAYPKLSASWLISDEPFFHLPTFKSLRLRGAFGASGQQPGTLDARFFSVAVQGKDSGTVEPGVSTGNLGNPNLKPERSQELELGLDAGLLGDRLSLELTYYTKSTRDALVLRDLPPSNGVAQSQFFNLGRIKNHGFEVTVDARVLTSKQFTWDMNLSGATSSNKVVTLGQGVQELEFGFYQRHVAGYPLGGFWGIPLLGFKDANSDGIIDASEITLGTQKVFMGNPIPTKEASLNNSFTLFKGRVRLGSQFDYRGGYTVDNSIENFRCSAVLNCRGLVDPTAPLLEQAKAQAVIAAGGNNFGFFEPGWFIKFRELSLTFYAPSSLARAIRAGSASITFAGRNLATITDYTGVDPEVNAFGQSNFSSSDFESQPQVRYWTVR